MAIRDLIPWSRSRRQVTVHPSEEFNPFLTLHLEMNRLFDDVFRGFDLARFGASRLVDRVIGWPNIEVSETDKELTVFNVDVSPPAKQVLDKTNIYAVRDNTTWKHPPEAVQLSKQDLADVISYIRYVAFGDVRPVTAEDLE